MAEGGIKRSSALALRGLYPPTFLNTGVACHRTVGAQVSLCRNSSYGCSSTCMNEGQAFMTKYARFLISLHFDVVRFSEGSTLSLKWLVRVLCVMFSILCVYPACGQQPSSNKPTPQQKSGQEHTPTTESTIASQFGNHTIHLLYDDSILSDSARAKLIALLAKQPPGDLKTITVTPQDQGITKLIQNNFHLSGITDKLSVDALASAIRALNGLASDTVIAGQTLRAPGLPSHVYRTNEQDKPAFRVATIGAKAITVGAAPEDLRANKGLPAAPQPRNGDLTAKEIADPQQLAELAWRSVAPVLPQGVFPLEDGGNVDIHLADASQCMAQQWLTTSPFYDDLHSSMNTYLAQPGNHTLLINGASSLPLVVIDWNDDVKKHGQKVTSVVKYLLNQLGVSDLTFHEVDLNPTNNSAELKTIFTDYLNDYYCSLQGIDCKSKGQKALIDDVSGWLKTKPQSVNGIASLKQLLLEAVLWKYFSSSRAIVNMSFSVDSLALEILQAQFLAASHSVGVVAASDDSQPQGTAGIPQRAASIYPNFLNVTYGNADGTILGGFSNSSYNIIVTTIAQGCGFTYADISNGDAGTSFAAPYVATALWLRSLMNNGDTSTLRRDLVEASDVSRSAQLPQVESSGTFDLATLLLPSSSYLLNSQGAAIGIVSGTLRVVSMKDTGGTIDESFTTGEHVSIAFVKRGGTLLARIRTLRNGAASPLPIAEANERVVQDVSLDIVVRGAANATHYDRTKIASSVVEVKF